MTIDIYTTQSATEQHCWSLLTWKERYRRTTSPFQKLNSRLWNMLLADDDELAAQVEFGTYLRFALGAGESLLEAYAVQQARTDGQMSRFMLTNRLPDVYAPAGPQVAVQVNQTTAVAVPELSEAEWRAHLEETLAALQLNSGPEFWADRDEPVRALSGQPSRPGRGDVVDVSVPDEPRRNGHQARVARTE